MSFDNRNTDGVLSMSPGLEIWVRKRMADDHGVCRGVSRPRVVARDLGWPMRLVKMRRAGTEHQT